MKTLIKNGWIYDGTLENVPFSGDVLVSGDRIEAVAPRIECEDTQIINAAGRVVCPGFIVTPIWRYFVRIRRISAQWN